MFFFLCVSIRYKNYLIDHITVSLNELELFIKHASEMLQRQVKSDDLKGLIEMMTFLSQVRTRQEYKFSSANTSVKDQLSLGVLHVRMQRSGPLAATVAVPAMKTFIFYPIASMIKEI